MLKLRDHAATFLRSEICNGNSALFWVDNWSNAGCLIKITGAGTQVLGISRYAMVSRAVSAGQRNFRRCRGCHLRAMIATITSIPAQWTLQAMTVTCFSSLQTWKQIRVHHPTVPWSKIVWFPQAIPRFSFIVWLALMDRLSTGTRSRGWGCIQPCLLCGEPDKTRDHMFFVCPYSFTVWIDLAGYLLGSRVNSDWSITITSLLTTRRREIDTCLLKLVFQTTRGTADGIKVTPQSAGHIVRVIDKNIKNMISSLRHWRHLSIVIWCSASLIVLRSPLLNYILILYRLYSILKA